MVNKKNIIYSFYLILVTLSTLYISDLILKKTFSNIKSGTIGKINAVVKHDLEFECTIWGASTAWVNINPKIISDSLNLSTLNMGIDGTNIDQYQGLLNEYLNYNEKSKYIIIAVDVNGGISDRNSFYHYHNWIHHIQNENIYNSLNDIDNERVFKTKYIPFYSLTQYDKHSFSPFIEGVKDFIGRKDDYEFKNNGFSPVSGVLKLNENIKSIAKNVIIGRRCIDKIKESCMIAKSKSIKPIVVITPCFYKGFENIKNASEVVDRIMQLRGSGIDVYDFSSSSITKDISCFYDNTHLNSEGADVFTKLFVNKIKSKY